MTVYYFDYILGNNATGEPDNSSLPYKDQTGLQTLLNGTVAAGDTVSFKSDVDFFVYPGINMYSIAGTSKEVPITFNTYGGTPKARIHFGYEITDWTDEGGGVFSKVISEIDWLYEDGIPLLLDSTVAPADGKWYQTGGVLYYNPTGTSVPTDHRVSRSIQVGFPLAGHDYLKFSNLKLMIEGFSLSDSVTGVVVDNCHFWGINRPFRGMLDWGAIVDYFEVTNCLFEYCGPNALYLYVMGGATAVYDRWTITGNRVAFNNTLPNGSLWFAGPDADVFSTQNLTNPTILDNDISGNTPTNGGESGGIYLYVSGGAGLITVTGAVDNGSGEIRLSISAPDPEGCVNGASHNYWSVGGVPNATGTWTIKNASGSGEPWVGTIDLDGSVFAGEYTSGGSGNLNPIRASQAGEIARNFIHDLVDAANLTFGIKLDSGAYPTNRSVNVHNNVIARIDGDGIEAINWQDPTLKSRILNNTIDQCVNGIYLNGKNWVIKNNLVSNVSGYYFYYGNGTDYSADNEADFNCYAEIGTDAKLWWGPDTPKTKTFTDWKTATGWDANSVTDAPVFNNASGGYVDAADYRLKSVSALIGAGTDVDLTTDFGGFLIVGDPDIGAWEYGSEDGMGGGYYSRGNYAALPAGDGNLENVYTAAEMASAAADDGDRVAQSATGEYAIHQFKNDATGKTSANVSWNGQTNLGCSPGNPVVLEIYNHNTDEWDELDRDEATGADTDFSLEATVANLANYKDSDNLMTCRVYHLGA